MSDLEVLLVDGLGSEHQFERRLQALKDAHRKQLQEAERRQREDLDRRIQMNSLLSTNINRKPSNERHSISHSGRSRSSSTPAPNSDRETSQQVTRQPERSVWKSLSNISPQCHKTKPKQSQKHTPSSNTLLEDEAECRKQFRAVPVPSHVGLPLYEDMLRVREEGRIQGHEERRNFLLSSQKPFSFLGREKEKGNKLTEMLNRAVNNPKNKAAVVRKPLPKETEKAEVSEPLKEVHTQTTAQETLRSCKAPVQNTNSSGDPEPRSSLRTKKEMLAILDEKPSFHPKINPLVPDFSRLHKTLQTDAMRRTERKDATRCKPFHLRTSTLPSRQSRMSPEDSQEPAWVSSSLKRSHSFGGLTSLSTDTLPTYITDSARQRCMAIRNSLELRDSKKQESEEWMRRYQTRSQAMKKAVAIRAQVMDPHSSLKEVYHEKLKQHREADQQRMRDYERELRDMKTRVSARPFLFEQMKQRKAKAHAEQTYRNKLKEAGFSEHFVEVNGAAAEVTQMTSISSSDEKDEHTIENDTQIREENVDDGEKIEEVEEKSVKSNGYK